MKIGTMVHFSKREGFEDKIRRMVSLGFDSFQLCSWACDSWTDENADFLAEIFLRYNVLVTAFWCGWSGPQVWDFYDGPKTLGLLPKKWRDERVQNLCDGADFAARLHITDVITHIGFIPENPSDPDFLPLCKAVRKVAEHLKANGQNLLFETGQETPAAMLRCFEEVGSSNLFVNLDTANLILYGKANPVDALDTIGKYVRNIHAKDGRYPTDGRSLGEETRIGCGKVDFSALFKKLKALNYDRYVTIEREIDGEGQIQDILFAREYLKSVIEK
jgi:L-ribulose-5-phosphate 3-epimerase